MLVKEIARGVVWLRTGMANSYLIESEEQGWVLLDAGTQGYARKIREAAEGRFGPGSRPKAIILSHGHFDHAGSARDLAERWDVSVYAHPMEAPYLTGRSAYPPPDPTVGGCMGLVSRWFPSTTTNIGVRLEDLPPGGLVPGLPGWRWYSTPGHSPGHVSYFHERSSVLLSGDAVTSVNMDSCSAMAWQKPEISRPPAYYTCDWHRARQSVEMLAELRPRAIGCGHGQPMSGPEVALQLWRLARHFPIPEGRYGLHPARTDWNGIVYLPPAPPDPLARIVAGLGAAALAGVGAWLFRRAARESGAHVRGA
jgi:glyoxylase-like metal-dependent hydrolase (beta-lactamase superfamily II)